MKIKVQLVIESENKSPQISSVGEWQKDEPLQPSNLGLALAEESA